MNHCSPDIDLLLTQRVLVKGLTDRNKKKETEEKESFYC